MSFGKNFFMLAAVAVACMVQSTAAQCNAGEMDVVQQCLNDNGMARMVELVGPRSQGCDVSLIDDELCTLASNMMNCINDLGLDPPCRGRGFMKQVYTSVDVACPAAAYLKKCPKTFKPAKGFD